MKTSIEIKKINEFDRHLSIISVAQELNTVSNHLRKAGYKRKLDIWSLHEFTQKSLWTEFPNANHCGINKIYPLRKGIKLLVIKSAEIYDKVKRKC